MTINSDAVWARIERRAGEEFRQLRGKPFTYDVSGRSIHLHTTNRMISRTAIEAALKLCPL